MRIRFCLADPDPFFQMIQSRFLKVIRNGTDFSNCSGDVFLLDPDQTFLINPDPFLLFDPDLHFLYNPDHIFQIDPDLTGSQIRNVAL